MKIMVFASSLALLLANSTHAQTDASGQLPPMTSHACIAASDTRTWANLGLTIEQTLLVEEVQHDCQKECVNAGQDRVAKDPSGVDKHDAKLRSILTADQYTKWVAWCAQPAKKSGVE